MDTTDLVSIIIPVYNPGHRFIRCIESCINQTYPNLEIILVDDCSTDPYTLELLEQYAAKDTRIRILRPDQNRGQAFCRNLGIDACRGKYFTLIDNDDSFAITFIERTHEAIVKHNTDMVMANICQYMDDTVPEDPSKWFNSTCNNLPFKNSTFVDFDFIIRNKLLMVLPIFVYGKLFNKERYVQAGLRFDDSPEVRSADDMLWRLHVCCTLRNFYFLPITGVFKRYHIDSDGTVISSNFFRRVLNCVRKCHAYLTEKNLMEIYNSILLVFFFNWGNALVKSLPSLEERYKQLYKNLDFLNTGFNLDLRRFPAKIETINGAHWLSLYSGLFKQYECAKVLWFSLNSIHDEANLNMVITRRFLEGLIDNGCTIKAITTMLHTPNSELTVIQQAILQIQKLNSRIRAKPKENTNMLSFIDNALNCLYIKLQNNEISTLNNGELRLLEIALLQSSKQYKPEVILVTGSDPCSLKLFALLKQAGFKLIYVATGSEDGFAQEGFMEKQQPTDPIYAARYELQGLYTVPQNGQEVFKLFDKVVTFSESIASAWRSRIDYPIDCLGYLERRTWLPDLLPEEKLVSITSNAPEHGFAIFLKVAMMMQERNREVKFVINLENHIPLQTFAEQYHFADGTLLKSCLHKLSNLKFVPHHSNLDRLYDQSCVMLLPELTQQHLAEPVLNALVNGVPVITTAHGERVPVKSGVSYIPTPKTTMQDYYCLPTDAEAEPFVAALETLLEQGPQDNRRTAMQAYDLKAAQQAWFQLLHSYHQ